MIYNFEKFEKRNQGNIYKGISVSKNSVLLSRGVYNAMSCPKFVNIFFDKDNLLIKIVGTDDQEDGYKVRGNNMSVYSKIGSIMPLGRYLYVEQPDTQTIICKLKESQELLKP